jgi:hypothetical protein
MRRRTIEYALGFGLALASIGATAWGQGASGQVRPPRRPPLRIEIVPSAQLYRQCVDWHVIEHRATGDTVVPQTRCRWAVRR